LRIRKRWEPRGRTDTNAVLAECREPEKKKEVNKGASKQRGPKGREGSYHALDRYDHCEAIRRKKTQVRKRGGKEKRDSIHFDVFDGGWSR